MTEQKKKTATQLQVLLGASLWGLIGLFNRQLTAGGFSAQSIVTVRNLGASWSSPSSFSSPAGRR